MSFLDDINNAYQKGISNPRNEKAIKYVKAVLENEHSVENLISKEIADERE